MNTLSTDTKKKWLLGVVAAIALIILGFQTAYLKKKSEQTQSLEWTLQHRHFLVSQNFLEALVAHSQKLAPNTPSDAWINALKNKTQPGTAIANEEPGPQSPAKDLYRYWETLEEPQRQQLFQAYRRWQERSTSNQQEWLSRMEQFEQPGTAFGAQVVTQWVEPYLKSAPDEQNHLLKTLLGD